MAPTESDKTGPNSYDKLDCSVARTLEHIGERWTFMVLRDAFYGIRRFDDFQASLGIARNILTKRLIKLVDAGILRKEPYQEHPPRYEYRLTEKGRDLVPILTALLAWGDKWETENGPPVRLIHTTCGSVMHTRGVCSECGGEINAFNLRLDPTPQIVVERVLKAKLAAHST
ncbi:MAG: helix-turn-helix domain-containing protein [Acidimicrobiia bacterium]|jgi:DNA-binding HxlR family transcriptional regulator